LRPIFSGASLSAKLETTEQYTMTSIAIPFVAAAAAPTAQSSRQPLRLAGHPSYDLDAVERHKRNEQKRHSSSWLPVAKVVRFLSPCIFLGAVATLLVAIIGGQGWVAVGALLFAAAFLYAAEKTTVRQAEWVTVPFCPARVPVWVAKIGNELRRVYPDATIVAEELVVNNVVVDPVLRFTHPTRGEHVFAVWSADGTPVSLPHREV
jgi:hypothetical protein